MTCSEIIVSGLGRKNLPSPSFDLQTRLPFDSVCLTLKDDTLFNFLSSAEYLSCKKRGGRVMPLYLPAHDEFQH
ncbi:hypothetical protein SAMN04489760_1342 [Syntrophus gentianae]|uniref:Uncharacterized protein n=1 Tax=Syntrophus gentianae TaxID=43775 RepID=A0A1H8ABZ6_9BACT|nr:hypothetical protein [Syntrophus gentianae]SEM68073.1 hypothetical protein SAMN04489760_1342 [Syntrophus gentianae]